MKDELGV